MMKPSTICKNLSLNILGLGCPVVVVPLPTQSPYNQKISKEIETLQSKSANSSVAWLLHALDASITIQRISLESLANNFITYKSSDLKSIDKYLDHNIELLDACNILLEKLDMLYKYVDLLRVVIHKFEGGFDAANAGTMASVRKALDACQTIERQCKEMSKCNLGYKKLNNKLSPCMSSQISCKKNSIMGCSESYLDEVLSGSLSFVTLVCESLSMALSYKSKHKVCSVQTLCLDLYDSAMLKLSTTRVTNDKDPIKTSSKQNKPTSSSWSSSFHELQKKINTGKHKMPEFERTVKTAQLLREQIKSQKHNHHELWKTVEELKRSCEKLDEGLKPFEEKVKELYRQLISFRMAMLGKVSYL